MKKITCLLLLVSATLLFQCTTAKQKKTVRCLDCDGWDWTWTEEAKKEMKKRGKFDFLHRNEFANRWVTNNVCVDVYRGNRADKSSCGGY